MKQSGVDQTGGCLLDVGDYTTQLQGGPSKIEANHWNMWDTLSAKIYSAAENHQEKKTNQVDSCRTLRIQTPP